MSASFFIALTLWLALFVLLPSFRDPASEEESQELLPGFRGEVSSLIATMKDLAYDWETGKLEETEYQELHKGLITRIISAVRQAGYDHRFIDESGQLQMDRLESLLDT